MKTDTKTKKSKLDVNNNGETIIKYNKKKLFIIIFIIFVILASTGLGVYFGVYHKRDMWPSNVQQTSWEKARSAVNEDANNNIDGEITLVIFANENNNKMNELIYGVPVTTGETDTTTSNEYDKTQLDGVLSTHSDIEASGYDNYEIITVWNDDSSVTLSEVFSKFWFGIEDEPSYIGNKDSEMLYLGVVNDNFDFGGIGAVANDPSQETSISYNEKTEDIDYFEMTLTEGVSVADSEPIFVWFEDGNPIFIASNIPDQPVEGEESSGGDTLEETFFFDDAVSWIEDQ